MKGDFRNEANQGSFRIQWRLSAGIITVQTALAAITMPLVLLVSHR
ncbi:hypothetical protein [Burkholderia gladioli]|nr:hypothetical protein [Burkholderia gladioli]